MILYGYIKNLREQGYNHTSAETLGLSIQRSNARNNDLIVFQICYGGIITSRRNRPIVAN